MRLGSLSLAEHLIGFEPGKDMETVGKGVHTPLPFSKISPFLEIEDVTTFYRPIGKTKVLKDSFNRFLYLNFYSQSILILEEYLQKR